jgi:CBS domain containing-hemolysin-like protein
MDTYLAACQLGITLASLLIGWLGEKAMTRQLLSLFDYIHITLPEQWIHIISITI